MKHWTIGISAGFTVFVALSAWCAEPVWGRFDLQQPSLRGEVLVALSQKEHDDRAEENEKKTIEGEEWNRRLPLLAHLATEQGVELPLPFGLSVTPFILQREVKVTEVAVGVDAPPQDISSYVSINTDNAVNGIIARGDVWLLPFLNLYALGGYIENTAEVDLTATLPPLIPGNDPRVIQVDIDTDLDGTLWAVGMTLAAGYDEFFLSLDGNYNRTDLGGTFDQTIDIYLISARTGWRGQLGNTTVGAWLGYMYWDSEQEIEGRIPVPGTNSTLNFKVNQGPENPENLLVGTNIEISRRLQIFLECGFNFDDLRMLTAGVGYRF